MMVEPPWQMSVVPLTLAVGNGLIVTAVLLLFMQPAPDVTVTLIVAVPALLAVQVILEVPWPAVIVPFVTDQV
jgi:hypothetical protein